MLWAWGEVSKPLRGLRARSAFVAGRSSAKVAHQKFLGRRRIGCGRIRFRSHDIEEPTVRKLTDDDVMEAMRRAGFGERERRAMTHKVWKDGIDIDRPTVAAIAFAQAVQMISEG